MRDRETIRFAIDYARLQLMAILSVPTSRPFTISPWRRSTYRSATGSFADIPKGPSPRPGDLVLSVNSSPKKRHDFA